MTQRLLSIVFPLVTVYNCWTAEAQTNSFCPTNMIQLYNGITCQTDQGCQRLSNGFFCFRGYCCANAVCEFLLLIKVNTLLFLALPGGYGSSCASNNQCSFSQAECLGGICYCRNGFNYDGQYCQPAPFNAANPCKSFFKTRFASISYSTNLN